MKILIDARLYGLENAGLGRYTMNLVNELQKIDNVNKYIILLRKRYYDKLEFKKNWQKVKVDIRHYSLSEQKVLPEIINKYEHDIVHFPHFNVPLLFSGKYVVTIHDLLMHKSKGKQATTLPFYKYIIKRLGYKTIFRHAILASKKIIVPSNFVKNELIDYYKLDSKRVKAIYEGYDRNMDKNRRKELILRKYNIDSPYFIYVGNAYPHKNLDIAIKAVLQLNKVSEKKILFLIASSRNIFARRLKEKIERLNGREFIKLLGFVPDEDLGGLLEHSLSFIYPSLSEGFGLQGLESMASGTLVIASDISVFKEVYKDNVIYFNPRRVSSLVKTMKQVLSISEEEREKRIKQGKEFIKRYSWSKMARQTLKIYKQVAN